ncbi:MAG: hypothetical protein AAB691_04545, partial [Patescibacteria group bacterium]
MISQKLRYFILVCFLIGGPALVWFLEEARPFSLRDAHSRIPTAISRGAQYLRTQQFSSGTFHMLVCPKGEGEDACIRDPGIVFSGYILNALSFLPKEQV